MTAVNVDQRVAGVIANYQPRLDQRSWDRLAIFVRAWVLSANPETTRKAKEFMIVATRYAHHCLEQLGIPPGQDLIYVRLADQFLSARRSDITAHSLAMSRSHLYDLIRRTDPHLNPVPATPNLRRSSEPYTTDDVSRIFAWARHRETQATTSDSLAIVTLGLGFGLIGAHTVGLTPGNFLDLGDQGILFDPDGRMMWCDESVEAPLRELLITCPRDRTLLRQQDAQQIKSFLNAARPLLRGFDTFVPSLLRLRSTWLSGRLTHLAPLLTVVNALGITHLSTLQPHMANLPRLPDEEARTVLRTRRSTAC